MNDTKVARILMDISKQETAIADAHIQKASMLRALAAEIESDPGKKEPVKPSPCPNKNPNIKAERKPDPESIVQEEINVDVNIDEELLRWLKELRLALGTTAHRMSWPF